MKEIVLEIVYSCQIEFVPLRSVLLLLLLQLAESLQLWRRLRLLGEASFCALFVQLNLAAIALFVQLVARTVNLCTTRAQRNIKTLFGLQYIVRLLIRQIWCNVRLYFVSQLVRLGAAKISWAIVQLQ